MTRAILNLCKLSAYLGGFLLCALILLIVISVAGRAAIGIGLGPVPGDFELVEMGMGIAIFFFMPWCYIKGGMPPSICFTCTCSLGKKES